MFFFESMSLFNIIIYCINSVQRVIAIVILNKDKSFPQGAEKTRPDPGTFALVRCVFLTGTNSCPCPFGTFSVDKFQHCLSAH